MLQTIVLNGNKRPILYAFKTLRIIVLRYTLKQCLFYPDATYVLIESMSKKNSATNFKVTVYRESNLTSLGKGGFDSSYSDLLKQDSCPLPPANSVHKFI